MVSLRRRRLLGYTTGLAPCYYDDEGVPQFGIPPANRITAQQDPIPYYFDDEGVARFGTRPPSTQMKNVEIPNSNLKQLLDQSPLVEKAKPERKHRKIKQQLILRTKKHKHEELEMFSLRGVYFKNMRWQAAIKVNKKQIHLGSHKTQAEAGRVYDRAAFVLQRRMNSELPESEKEELRKMKWDEFVERSRLEAILKRRRIDFDDSGSQNKSLELRDLRNEPGQGTEGASSSAVAKLV